MKSIQFADKINSSTPNIVHKHIKSIGKHIWNPLLCKDQPSYLSKIFLSNSDYSTKKINTDRFERNHKLTNFRISNQANVTLTTSNTTMYKSSSWFKPINSPLNTVLTETIVSPSKAKYDIKQDKRLQKIFAGNRWCVQPFKTFHKTSECKSDRVKQTKDDLSQNSLEANRKRIIEKQLKYENFHHKLLESKKQFQQEKVKINEMQKLKLKWNKILKQIDQGICPGFESKISGFNYKIFDFLVGNFNWTNEKKYHSRFRYGKNPWDEGHDRINMIMNIDSLKANAEEIHKDLEKNLTLYERQLIMNDPIYFSKELGQGSNKLQTKTLAKRLNEEGQEIIFKNIWNTEETNETEREWTLQLSAKTQKNKMKIRLGPDLDTLAIETKKKINCEVNTDRTNKAKESKNETWHDYFVKRVKKMHLSIGRLKPRTHNTKICKFSRGNMIEKRLEYEKLMRKYRKNNQVQNGEMIDDLQNLTIKDFTKEEQDVINNCLLVIKGEGE